MDLQELLAKIEVMAAKDVEMGVILRAIVVHIARLERAAASPKTSKDAK